MAQDATKALIAAGGSEPEPAVDASVEVNQSVEVRGFQPRGFLVVFLRFGLRLLTFSFVPLDYPSALSAHLLWETAAQVGGDEEC